MNITLQLKKLAILSLVGFTFSCSSDDVTVQPLTKDQLVFTVPTTPIQPNGFYITNEDWFGHSNGTVNFFSYDLVADYRVFQQKNSGKTLGATTQFATNFGNYYYFVSKQENRLVVTDKQLKEVKALKDIQGDEQGRAFVGVTPSKGYISTSKGITIFDIETLTTTTKIAGINSETGSMVTVNNKVYAVVQQIGLVVINALTDTVEKTYEGNYSHVTIDAKGIVWAGRGTELVKINPFTEEEKIIDVSAVTIPNYPVAWHAGSLTASMKSNSLYWATTTKQLVKFDTETESLTVDFYNLGKDAEGNDLDLYGAGIRVDPFTDNIVATAIGNSYNKNWVRLISPAGQFIKEAFLLDGTTGENGYYWFPAVPFFQDNHTPEVLLTEVNTKPNQTIEVPLNKIAIDQDSPFQLISIQAHSADTALLEVNIVENTLLINTKQNINTTYFTIDLVSNGKKTSKKITVNIIN